MLRYHSSRQVLGTPKNSRASREPELCFQRDSEVLRGSVVSRCVFVFGSSAAKKMLQQLLEIFGSTKKVFMAHACSY